MQLVRINQDFKYDLGKLSYTVIGEIKCWFFVFLSFGVQCTFELNCFGQQIHPEKYQQIGERSLKYLAFLVNTVLCFKDTHKEKVPSNKAPALRESTNMDVWTFGTLNQLFIRAS